MSGTGPAPSFAFDAQYRKRAEAIIGRYPEGRQASAILPLLDLAQRLSGGWLPRAAIEYVADFLGMPVIRAHEVATFYSMFSLEPVGGHKVLVCTTTPCWLRGSDAVVKACETALGISLGETAADGRFTLAEVECLGACVNAPMMQIDDDYYEDLDAARATAVLDALKRGESPRPGPQIDRQTSAPAGGPTTLLAPPGAG